MNKHHIARISWAEVAEQYPLAKGECCSARGPDDYLCTRPTGHDGPHVAHVSDDVALVMWTTPGQGE